MKTEIEIIKKTFSANLASVDDLIDFDQLILMLATSNLKKIVDTLEVAGKVQAARDVQNRMAVLENIRSHASMKKHYGTIFGQGVVLLVSYFASVTQDLFKSAASHAFTSGSDAPVTSQEVKLTWRDLSAEIENPAHAFAELLVTQKDISFQDMQSIARAFSNYFGIEIQRESHVNDIIVAQAARHSIVHNGGIVDKRMINQLNSAKPRTIKRVVTMGEEVKFVPDEVRAVAAAMKEYVENLIRALEGRFPAA